MHKRSAFTLVELLVAVTLVIFIMLLLTQAFVAGVEAFRQLKSLGDLDEKLRTAGVLLNSDLSALHFDGDRKLSQTDFFLNGPPNQGFVRFWQGTGPNAQDPKFPSPPNLPNPSPFFGGSYQEGADGDGVISTMAAPGCPGSPPGSINPVTSYNHMIHMTVRKPSTNNPQDFFVANVSADPAAYLDPTFTTYGWASLGSPQGRYQVQFPVPTFTSQWAEVAYFLRDSGQQTAGDDPAKGIVPMRLYTLYRRQRLAVMPLYGVERVTVNNNTLQFPANDPANNNPNTTRASVAYFQGPGLGAASGTAYAEVSCVPSFPNGAEFGSPYNSTTPLHFNNPADLTVPANRLGGLPLPPPNPPPGSPWVGTVPQSPTGQTQTYPTLQEEASAYGWGTATLGDDVLLTDVISFQIQFLDPTTADFIDIPPCQNNPAFAGIRVFDTWCNGSGFRGMGWNAGAGAYKSYGYNLWPIRGSQWSLPLGLASDPVAFQGIQAVRVTIRVWDKRTSNTRERSIIVGL
jgi:hypothetical protein